MYRCLCGILVLFLARPCGADIRTQQVLDSAKFDALGPQQMDGNSIYFNEKVLPFSEWAAAFPRERQNLALYPGYEEPMITVAKNGLHKQLLEKLMVFVARSKLVLNKAPNQINLKALTKLDSIRDFDEEIEHVQIQPSQLMSAVAGRGPITNFQWCNKTGQNILRPFKELDLTYTNPKTRTWCADVAHSICVESCYLFSNYWYEGVKFVNLAMEAGEKKDYGIAMQSEIRYFSDEHELDLAVPLAVLTQLNSPVRGGLEQNIFYFNQVMEFGKILAVLQDDPMDPSKTVATAFFVVGIKQRTYNQFSEVKNVLLGQSTLLNTKSGITAGLPVFTRNMVSSIAGLLER